MTALPFHTRCRTTSKVPPSSTDTTRFLFLLMVTTTLQGRAAVRAGAAAWHPSPFSCPRPPGSSFHEVPHPLTPRRRDVTCYKLRLTCCYWGGGAYSVPSPVPSPPYKLHHSFLTWIVRGSERVRNLPSVTQLVSSKARTWTPSCLISKSVFFDCYSHLCPPRQTLPTSSYNSAAEHQFWYLAEFGE